MHRHLSCLQDMFFLIERKDTLALAPKYFGRNVNDKIYEQLKLKVQGKCTGQYGYTILVTSLQEVGRGQLHPVCCCYLCYGFITL